MIRNKVRWFYFLVYPYIDIMNFTKNIGLTSDVRIDTLTQDTIAKWMLIDYHLGK
jgi:hypothetical protein